MSTITLESKAIPIVKSSLFLREKLLGLKLTHYVHRLKALEKKHKMSSSEFLKNLEKGRISDEAFVVEWEYLIETCHSLKEQLHQINYESIL